MKCEERRVKIGRFFLKNQVEINCVLEGSSEQARADFCHDSAITKQALMALTAPKVEKSWGF